MDEKKCKGNKGLHRLKVECECWSEKTDSETRKRFEEGNRESHIGYKRESLRHKIVYCGYHIFWPNTPIQKAQTDQIPQARSKYPHMNMVLNNNSNPGS